MTDKLQPSQQAAVSRIIRGIIRPRKKKVKAGRTDQKRIKVNDVAVVEAGTLRMSGGARTVGNASGGGASKHIKVPNPSLDDIITGSMSLKTIGLETSTPQEPAPEGQEAEGYENELDVLDDMIAHPKRTMGQIVGDFVRDIIDLNKED